MSTEVRIGRVVLDGLELSRRQRDALGPAIARELGRLGGHRADEHGAADRRQAGPVVDGIAQQVAAVVHRAASAAQPTAGGPSAGGPGAGGPGAGRPGAGRGR